MSLSNYPFLSSVKISLISLSIALFLSVSCYQARQNRVIVLCPGVVFSECGHDVYSVIPRQFYERYNVKFLATGLEIWIIFDSMLLDFADTLLNVGRDGFKLFAYYIYNVVGRSYILNYRLRLTPSNIPFDAATWFS